MLVTQNHHAIFRHEKMASSSPPTVRLPRDSPPPESERTHADVIAKISRIDTSFSYPWCSTGVLRTLELHYQVQNKMLQIAQVYSLYTILYSYEI